MKVVKYWGPQTHAILRLPEKWVMQSWRQYITCAHSRESTWRRYRWRYLYTYIFVYLKNKTTKNYLISSNFFWHIMNFKSDTSKFSNTIYQTSIWVQVNNCRVTLVLNNWNRPAAVTGGPTERLFQTSQPRWGLGGRLEGSSWALGVAHLGPVTS